MERRREAGRTAVTGVGRGGGNREALVGTGAENRPARPRRPRDRHAAGVNTASNRPVLSPIFSVGTPMVPSIER